MKQISKEKIVFFFVFHPQIYLFSRFVGQFILSIPSILFFIFVLLPQHPPHHPIIQHSNTLPNFWLFDFGFWISIFDFGSRFPILTSQISDLPSDSQIYPPISFICGLNSQIYPSSHLRLMLEEFSDFRKLVFSITR